MKTNFKNNLALKRFNQRNKERQARYLAMISKPSKSIAEIKQDIFFIFVNGVGEFISENSPTGKQYWDKGTDLQLQGNPNGKTFHTIGLALGLINFVKENKKAVN